MLKTRLGAPICAIICLSAFIFSPALAAPLDFSLSSHGSGKPEILIIGGIQGDEPGGFSAAALLATHYTFSQGTVHVVPNLNFPAIIERSRGPHGDMNRKFAALSDKDPEYDTVRRIQAIITQPGVDLILNLHDGSGFYRPKAESALYGPQRWGQSVIIDQTEWPDLPFGNLKEIADKVVNEANALALRPEHYLHVHNTKTATEDKEMAKSLTWFALNHNKAAFGLEASKEFGDKERAFYHLCMVEAFLRHAGLSFERSFELSPEGVGKALSSDIYVAFMDNRLVLPLENARRQQAGSLPMPRGAENSASANMPIIAVTADRNLLTVHYGNNRVTSFKPDWSETDDGLSGVTVLVDGVQRQIKFGETLDVSDTFMVEKIPGYRVNAIGAQLGRDESGMNIKRRDFIEAYSVDKAGHIYRVEVYRDKLYCGTFLARFRPQTRQAEVKAVLPAIKGPESDLGR